MIIHSNNDDQMKPMPDVIVQAISEVMSTVDAVKKTQRNNHGGYDFASTDDIYAALARKLGQVGLVILPLEEKCEIVKTEVNGKTVQWAHLIFTFVLSCKGETWTHKTARRTLYIQVLGPQTFQAAQSYVEKAFLRSLFKLPTGDLDLDTMPEADNEEDQIALNANGRKKRKSSAAAKRDGTTEKFNALMAKMQKAETLDELLQLRTDYATDWAEAPQRWEQLLEDEYETAQARIMKEFA